MVTTNVIKQLFANSGAIAQDNEGTFLFLTNMDFDSSSLKTFLLNHSICVNSLNLYAPHFFDSSETDLKSFNHCLIFKRDFLIDSLENELRSTDIHLDPPWIVQSKLDYESDFNKIQQAIYEGLISKAVVMSMEASPWVPSVKERMQLCLNLLKNCSANLFIYGHWNEKGGVLGATPEILFYRRKQIIQTMALAGTLAKYSKSTVSVNANQLLHDPKELYEHQLVVDDITEKLNNLSKDSQYQISKFSIDGPKIFELPHLFHLQSKIEIELATTFRNSPLEESNFDLFLSQQIHPSSALGIRSSRTHWHWLKNLFGHKALGHFGAPFGISLPNGYLCLVGIRNLEWENDKSFIRSGCGIVEQSKSNKEWQELFAKRESVKSLLGFKSIS